MNSTLHLPKIYRQFICQSAILLSIVLLSGCGGSSSAPQELQNLAKVQGAVSYKGKPVDGASITFYRCDSADAGPSVASVATVEPDGRFAVQSIVSGGSRSGMIPGKYVATISWVKPKNPSDRDSDLGPELLPKKYQDQNKSGLEFEIRPGQNSLEPIELAP